MDNTIRFSDIWIIESLSEPGWACRTGAHLRDEIEPLAAASTPTVQVHFRTLTTRAELFALLDAIAIDARERGRSPLLHFETHGGARGSAPNSTSAGIYVASDELVRWTDLMPALMAINIASRLNLVAVVAACNGADLATIVQPLERAPVRLIIGPKRVLTFNEVEKGTMAFYRGIFEIGDGVSAWKAMNAAIDPTAQTFWAIPVDWMFRAIMRGYFEDFCNERAIAARAEKLLAPLALRGVPAAVLARERVKLRRHLGDREALRTVASNTFFMLDLYPENAQRFERAIDGTDDGSVF
jgi:hypothetical protein